MKSFQTVIFVLTLFFSPGYVHAEKCDPFPLKIAQNFCVSITESEMSENCNATPIPDPISVGGFTGISCRFGIWLEKICSIFDRNEISAKNPIFVANSKNQPTLAPPQTQTIDFYVGAKNIICVPIKIVTE